MGLMSFIKKAGNKIFGKKEAAAPQPTAEAKVVLTEEQKKIQALQAEVSRLGIPVSNLNLELGESISVRGNTETNADREKIILALGNVEGVSVVEDNIVVANPEPEATFYTVQSGDSLSKISKSVYGDPMKYNDIFEANKPMLEHPDKIYPGQVLRIPAQG
ncbi:MAG: peptidoglycan-binding protein LysM [Saprospiraceae bacterium]